MLARAKVDIESKKGYLYLATWKVITMPRPEAIRIRNGYFSSVQFSHSVVSDSLRPHESQDARPP